MYVQALVHGFIRGWYWFHKRLALRRRRVLRPSAFDFVVGVWEASARQG